MKRFFCIVLSALLICSFLLSMSSCGKGKILDTIVSDEYKYELYGKNTVNHIKVYKNSNLVYSTDISGIITDNGAYEHYGFIYKDMNFDGAEDFGLIVSTNSGNARYSCYTYNQTTSKFSKNQYLSILDNVNFDNENQCVIEMQVSKIYDEPVLGNNDPLDYTESKTKIIYNWADEKLVEQTRTSLVYYSESDIYSYITYTYDSSGKAEEDNELWIEPSEIESFIAKVEW